MSSPPTCSKRICPPSASVLHYAVLLLSANVSLEDPANIINQIYQIYELIQSIIQIIGDIQLLCGATAGSIFITIFRLAVVVIRFAIRIVFSCLPFSNPFETTVAAKNAINSTTNDAVDGIAKDGSEGNTAANTSESVVSKNGMKRSSSETEPLLATGSEHTTNKL